MPNITAATTEIRRETWKNVRSVSYGSDMAMDRTGHFFFALATSSATNAAS